MIILLQSTHKNDAGDALIKTSEILSMQAKKREDEIYSLKVSTNEGSYCANYNEEHELRSMLFEILKSMGLNEIEAKQKSLDLNITDRSKEKKEQLEILLGRLI